MINRCRCPLFSSHNLKVQEGLSENGFSSLIVWKTGVRSLLKMSYYINHFLLTRTKTFQGTPLWFGAWVPTHSFVTFNPHGSNQPFLWPDFLYLLYIHPFVQINLALTSSSTEKPSNTVTIFLSTTFKHPSVQDFWVLRKVWGTYSEGLNFEITREDRSITLDKFRKTWTRIGRKRCTSTTGVTRDLRSVVGRRGVWTSITSRRSLLVTIQW